MSSDDVSARLPSAVCMPKVVRDLLWTVTSPHMLSGDRFPVLPPEFGVEALECDVVIDWLNSLIEDPAPLLAFMQGKPQRLTVRIMIIELTEATLWSGLGLQKRRRPVDRWLWASTSPLCSSSGCASVRIWEWRRWRSGSRLCRPPTGRWGS